MSPYCARLGAETPGAVHSRRPIEPSILLPKNKRTIPRSYLIPINRLIFLRFFLLLSHTLLQDTSTTVNINGECQFMRCWNQTNVWLTTIIYLHFIPFRKIVQSALNILSIISVPPYFELSKPIDFKSIGANASLNVSVEIHYLNSKRLLIQLYQMVELWISFELHELGTSQLKIRKPLLGPAAIFHVVN